MDIALFVIGAIVVTAFGIKLFLDNTPASGVRARNDKGHYVKDDPTTAKKNEAYKDGKTPPVKKAPVKRKPVANQAPAQRSRRRPANKK